MKQLFFLFLIAALTACNPNPKKPMSNELAPILKTGIWRATLALTADAELPFNFEVDAEGHLFIINAAERLKVTEISKTGDSIQIIFPVFGTYIKAKLSANGDSLTGVWVNPDKKDYEIPFFAQFDRKERFAAAEAPAIFDANGRWSVTFSPGTADSYPAIGVFEQNEHQVTGTFLTETGDYRYLEGQVEEGKISLSCFDGAHAFLFTATGNGDSITNGVFYSGKHWQEPWSAIKNDSVVLADADTLTYLKDGYDKLAFAFADDKGDTVRLTDARFKGKVVIVQIMGTWCPNCMDETIFFVELHQKYHKQGLEIIAIDYEIRNDYEVFQKNIARMRRDLGVEYTCLFGGPAKKAEAAATLPMLNHILSYPTAIFMDKMGEIQKIQTGFSGPGTGALYDEYVSKTTKMIERLLKE
jgi:thiol-disulfide isomerase/thioredoxin